MHRSSSTIDYDAQQRAKTLCEAQLSPRYLRLDRLERYVEGSQYEGRPSFEDTNYPLFERAPSIVYPMAHRAIRSHADLVLGEKRWPTITSFADEDDEAFDPRFGLSEDESKILDRCVEKIVKQASLKALCDEALVRSLGCGTAVAICGVRAGKVVVDVVAAKCCEPTFDASGNVTALEIRYPYVESFFDDRKQRWSARCMMFRREITTTADIVYRPLELNGATVDADDWIVDPARTVQHDLGFCPVLWYRRAKRNQEAANIDGVAIHEMLLDEIDGLNFALSQRHRSAIYSGNPQVVETGVASDYNPAPMGRKPTLWVPGDPDVNKQWTGNIGGIQNQNARMAGPGIIWRYEDKESKVSFLTLPGDALKSLEEDATALGAMLRDALAFVDTDPERTKLGSDISGRALQWLYQKELAVCDKIREDFGERFMLPLICMLLRIVQVVGARGGALYLGGVDKLLPILDRFNADIEDGDELDKQWFDPYLCLEWPPYFELTEQDKKAAQDQAIEARDAKLITTRTAVERIAPFYSIGNVDQYLETLEGENEEREQKANAMQHALFAAAQPKEAPAVEETTKGVSRMSEPQEEPEAAEQPPARAVRTPPKFKRRMKARQPQPLGLA